MIKIVSSDFQDNFCEFINSLWPGDPIWRHGTRSTLAQVKACCLTAPSLYLNQCWLIIGEVPWHSRALPLDDVKIPINKTRLKIAVLKWHPGLPGANELMLKSFRIANKGLLVLYSQHHGCCWSGDGRSQGISSRGIDLGILKYSSFSAWRMKNYQMNSTFTRIQPLQALKDESSKYTWHCEPRI